jgi:hypothetical protein
MLRQWPSKAAVNSAESRSIHPARRLETSGGCIEAILPVTVETAGNWYRRVDDIEAARNTKRGFWLISYSRLMIRSAGMARLPVRLCHMLARHCSSARLSTRL